MNPKFDAQRHHRRSIRLKGYDYTQAGAYFVTVVTQGRECLFGEIVDGEIRLNEIGKLVGECWNALPQHFRHVELDEFVMMPNHVHGILVLAWDVDLGDSRDGEFLDKYRGGNRGDALVDDYRGTSRGEAFAAGFAEYDISAANGSPLHGDARAHGTKPRSVNAIVQNFKSVASRKVNQSRDSEGAKVWQRDYFEHVIRNERELERIREYIGNNPAAWESDDENPVVYDKTKRVGVG